LVIILEGTQSLKRPQPNQPANPHGRLSLGACGVPSQPFSVIIPVLIRAIHTPRTQAVHRNALEFAVPQSLNLLEQLMNVQPEHCRPLEHPDDIHSRNTV
jgi:hypothetical protein